MTLCIGVLALQGDFARHIEMLTSLQVETQEVRQAKDLEKCDGLILPGGESTVIQRQLDFIGLREPLIQFANKKPVFGTCAGLILMSKQIQGSSMKSLNLLDISVERNAFGRQAHSFEASILLQLIPNSQSTLFPAFFIRAPRIRANGSQVQILGTWQNEAVFVRQGHLIACSFHPELTKNSAIHHYFIQMVKELLN